MHRQRVGTAIYDHTREVEAQTDGRTPAADVMACAAHQHIVKARHQKAVQARQYSSQEQFPCQSAWSTCTLRICIWPPDIMDSIIYKANHFAHASPHRCHLCRTAVHRLYSHEGLTNEAAPLVMKIMLAHRAIVTNMSTSHMPHLES